MPTMKIEHKCKCGACRFVERNSPHVPDDWWYAWGNEELDAPRFCPHCGCYLHKNGFAYEMVRADEALTLCERAAQFIEVGLTPMAALACARMELCETADEGSDDE